jgi:predicted acylesterase/phospholipase RssA
VPELCSVSVYASYVSGNEVIISLCPFQSAIRSSSSVPLAFPRV